MNVNTTNIKTARTNFVVTSNICLSFKSILKLNEVKSKTG